MTRCRWLAQRQSAFVVAGWGDGGLVFQRRSRTRRSLAADRVGEAAEREACTAGGAAVCVLEMLQRLRGNDGRLPQRAHTAAVWCESLQWLPHHAPSFPQTAIASSHRGTAAERPSIRPLPQHPEPHCTSQSRSVPPPLAGHTMGGRFWSAVENMAPAARCPLWLSQGPTRLEGVHVPSRAGRV
ncbi:hypothetical protein K505DRAFT_143114 [Melanomma pulvis-pyrius CBS 109.77]|uniref:Uncharacterized protein n=1 Tax=Melanomma pulvis-pyrius CBS 109.77 TaxID=1314802 RepID=A0A6A6WR67_9PLEO|nr:hypothetical protein K505DRAFT_143114 [Melanomma pulvis-pyrius CBS 109.77]